MLLLGLFGGVALAKGLSAVFDAMDLSMPQAGLVLAIVQAAGWPIWFLLLASVIAVALIIERSVSLRAMTRTGSSGLAGFGRE